MYVKVRDLYTDTYEQPDTRLCRSLEIEVGQKMLLLSCICQTYESGLKSSVYVLLPFWERRNVMRVDATWLVSRSYIRCNSMAAIFVILMGFFNETVSFRFHVRLAMLIY